MLLNGGILKTKMFICEENMHCVDCPRHDPTESCCHWIEVEPVKRGKWEKLFQTQYDNETIPRDTIQCSICRTKIRVIAGERPNYCSNCGARMESEEE